MGVPAGAGRDGAQVPVSHVDRAEALRRLQDAANQLQTRAEALDLIARVRTLTAQVSAAKGSGLPATPIDLACATAASYRRRPHLELLSATLAQAVADVAAGTNRRIIFEVSPRAGKSLMTCRYGPLWTLQRHPEWEIVMASFDPSLTSAWARDLRREIESDPALGVVLARDAGAGTRWQTLQGGGVFATSVRGGLTGRGAKVLIIDDPIKDFVEAHSAASRDQLWNWWLTVAQTRLEPVSLVIVVMTRWHTDDLVGRLLSEEYEGDPSGWTVVRIPALAEPDDPLGRDEGEPLISPMHDETRDEALARFQRVRSDVGEYAWSALYQQRPAPARGEVFDIGWWRWWTDDPAKATDDGRVMYYPPDVLAHGRWLDSWDLTFTAGESSDWVVGQRWCRVGPDRLLVDQQRGRWAFSRTLDQMRRWATGTDSGTDPYGHLVHERVVEHAANGAAAVDVLKREVAGLRAVTPRGSKEVRARAVTPEIETGHVRLPMPSAPGKAWVNDLLSELRDFPHGSHDDQCLVSGTLVETPYGSRRIEDVRAGDTVLGRTGWVEVLAAGQTGTTPVLTRCGMTGTPGHPVMTARGWVALGDVAPSDEVTVLPRSALSAAALRCLPEGGAVPAIDAGTGAANRGLRARQHGGESREANTLVAPVPSAGLRSEPPAGLGCADRAGSPQVGRAGSSRSSSMGSSFVDTQTPPTPRTADIFDQAALTLRAESMLCTERSTDASTDRSRTDGTCTTSMPILVTTSQPTSSLSPRQSTLRSPSRSGHDAEVPGTTSMRCSLIWTASEDWHSQPSEPVPVFNLRTSDGTYFANGVLVHNCDALSQALAALRDSRGTVTVPTRGPVGPGRGGGLRRADADGLAALRRR